MEPSQIDLTLKTIRSALEADHVENADRRIDNPVRLLVRRRLPWLCPNTAPTFLTAWVISFFEGIFSEVAILAIFQSVVARIGGNAATQSLAMIVRAKPLGDITAKEAFSPLLKQITVGFITGIAVGAVASLGVFLWKGNPYLGLILGLALISSMVFAVIIGTLIPIFLKAPHLEHAPASSVLVTSVTDNSGFALCWAWPHHFSPI